MIRSSEEVCANLFRLIDILSEQAGADSWSVYDFSLWLQGKIASSDDEDTGELAGSTQDGMKVTVSTIHRAKGLEFPVVFLPFLEREISNRELHPTVLVSANGTMELRQQYYHRNQFVASLGYSDEAKAEKKAVLAEEMRILYVACTRAEERLYLVGNPSAAEGKECPWTWLSQAFVEGIKN